MQETNAIHELANVSTVGFKKAYQIALQSYRVDGDGFKTRFLAANAADSGVVNHDSRQPHCHRQCHGYFHERSDGAWRAKRSGLRLPLRAVATFASIKTASWR